MYTGRVMGSATATVKHPSMEGCKLLLVMALQADGRTVEGDPILVVDTLGAGRGDTVMITSDGMAAREITRSQNSPVRWTVLAIPDRRIAS
jgi:ethanolamine utilization protein EutN